MCTGRKLQATLFRVSYRIFSWGGGGGEWKLFDLATPTFIETTPTRL